MLNILWGSFFIIAFLIAIYQSFIEGNYGIWNKLVNSAFSSSQNAFNIALSLTGLLCFWLGLLKIAEKSGIINVVAKILRPLFQKIMPEVPSDSPALGSVIMNISANVLGLDNAATPMGLKAMEQLQELPGVGRKTANVVMAVAFRRPAMPVDTHVFRVANRIGLANHAKTPLEVEKQLVEHIPAGILSNAHHWFILHGRYVCMARKPKCPECGIRPWCKFFSKK